MNYRGSTNTENSSKFALYFYALAIYLLAVENWHFIYRIIFIVSEQLQKKWKFLTICAICMWKFPQIIFVNKCHRQYWMRIFTHNVRCRIISEEHASEYSLTK